MAVSLHAVTVPVYLNLFGTLAATLDKAAAHAARLDVEPEVFITARLYPDMWSLAEQVHAATNHAVRGTARLAGAAIPDFNGEEETFAGLKGRIDWAVAHLNALTEAQFEGAEERTIVFPTGGTERRMSGADYLLKFSMPNFYFHLSMVYAILRHNGVPLAKEDFVGD